MSRVVLLSEFFPPEHGGIQWSLEVATRAFGNDLTVVAPPHPAANAYDQNKPWRMVRRSLFSGGRWPRWWWLVRWLREQAPEFIIFGHFSAATVAGWLSGRPYAILIHGRDLLVEQRWPIGPLIRPILRRAAWIGVNSLFTGQLVARYGVHESRIIQTHPAVDDNLLHKSGTTHSDLRVLTVARLVARKNVASVIRAIGSLTSEFPNLQYDVIGDGPEDPHLRRLVNDLDLSSRITFHGLLTDQAKWERFALADIAVMTPLVREGGSDVEGLGIFYLEAAAFGLPLIASQTGGVTDIVHHDQTGLLVDPTSIDQIAEAIKQLLTNQAQRAQLGEAARQLVKQEFTTTVRNRRFEMLLKRQGIPHPPLVSVIIPAYQSADTIGRTLRSLEQQTWREREIIIVDDGSTDDLEGAILPFAGRVQVLRQANAGAAAARNTGAAKARGQYLLFVDADTVFKPDFITRLVIALETHPNASYAYSSFRFGPKGFRLFEFDPTRLRQQNYIHTTSLIRRSDFPGFDPTLKKFQDWDLWLTMLEQNHTGLWVAEELFAVAQRSAGVQSAHQISSQWLPSFVYRLPLVGQGKGSPTIRKYREAERIIRTKHQLG